MKPSEKAFICPFCGGYNATQIRTYKSIWVSCDNCGNITRKLKDKFLLEFIPKWVWGPLSSQQKMNPTGLRARIYYAIYKSEDANLYDYYLSESQDVRGGFSLSSTGTKWEGESQSVINELKEWDVTLEDKNVLEISGGPGYFAKELSPFCKRWVVTEYSQVSADRMREIFNLDAVKFDLNSDDLAESVDETFDVIFLRHCINFSVDIGSFLVSLKKIIKPNAVIYCSFTQPTLASCLRWSLDDYTFKILYNPETIQKIFAEEGFIAFGKKEQGTRHWIYGGYWTLGGIHWGHVLASPFTIPYYFLNRLKNINISAREKNSAMIFRKNPNVCR